jgi:hypothetical protein
MEHDAGISEITYLESLEITRVSARFSSFSLAFSALNLFICWK